MLQYSCHHQPHVRALSEEQIRELHLATLEILERTGVIVREKRALELLKKAGARVAGERVRIPAPLVEQAIQQAPERVVLSKRTGERTVALEANRVFFGTGSDTPNTIDPETRQRRRSQRADVARMARLCDALPNLDFIMSMGVATDVNEHAPFLYEFVDMMAGSSKPIVFTARDTRDMEEILEMASAVVGGEEALRANPFLLHYAEPISPLTHSPEGLRKLLFCADHQVPVVYVSGMSAGGSAPCTLAGALTVASAECLSGLVIHQLAFPGSPFVYGANISSVDLRTMNFTYGGPELPITNAALADMARHYGLPCWGLAGASDAKRVDAQAGLDAMLSITMAVLSRGNLVHDVGYLESGLTSSMEMITLCDEIISLVKVMFRGIPMSADHFALDVIDEVGPGGYFLGADHTAKFFRQEFFLPTILDRDNFETWEQKGSPSLEDRANKKVLELLASHKPAPLPEAAKQVIEAVLNRTAAREG